MRGLVGSCALSRPAGIVLMLCLGVAEPAWAGDGGSLGSLQSLLNRVCGDFQVTCPQLPTITQLALEVAAQFNVPTEIVRSEDNDPPAAIAANPPLETAQSPIDLSTAALTPLAFVAGASAKATALGDPKANSFFYAVTSTFGASSEPDTLSVIYEDVSRTTETVAQGQNVAEISLPLVVLSGGSEREVPTTLQFIASCSGKFANCVTTALATGNFSGKGTSTYTADQIGLKIASSFATSQVSTSFKHAIIQVDVPLIVTSGTDPLYFQNVNPVVLRAFLGGDQTGFSPKSGNILGPKASIGIAPYAAPLCTKITCPPPEPPTPPPSQFFFSFCASLSDNKGNLVPAVGAFAAIANSGETLVSAPVPSSPLITCPPF